MCVETRVWCPWILYLCVNASVLTLIWSLAGVPGQLYTLTPDAPMVWPMAGDTQCLLIFILFNDLFLIVSHDKMRTHTRTRDAAY